MENNVNKKICQISNIVAKFNNATDNVWGKTGQASGQSKRLSRLPAWLIKPINEICPEKLSDEQLYQKCREYGMNAKQWSRRFAGLLPEVARRGLHRRKGFLSIQQFAGQLAGMSEYAVDRIFQIYNKIKDKPHLLKLFQSGAEGWSKIEVVAYIATVETDKLWAEKLVALSRPALLELVKNYRLKSPACGEKENVGLFCQGGGVSAGVDGNGRGGVQNFAEDKNLFNQNLKEQNGGNGIVVNKNTGEIMNYPFDPPVRFSFPASKEVEFDLRLAKHKMEKQSKQVLTWNETFEMLIKKSDLAGGNITKFKSVNTSGRCNKCHKVGRIQSLEICDECMKRR